MQRGLVGSEMCIRDRYQRRVHGYGINALKSIHSKASIEYLINMIKRKDVMTKKIVSDALTEIKNPKVFPSFYTVLNDLDSWVRYFAVISMGKIHHEEVKEKLIERLKYESCSYVILEILNTLKSMNIKGEIDQILYHFVQEEDDEIAAAAISCYEKLINQIDVREKLIKKLNTDSWKIKKAILDVLGKVDLKKDEIVHILPLIKDDNILVKEKAVDIVLGYPDYSILLPVISTMLESNLKEITFQLSLIHI
eukprot:TRINITY_DN10977_c0_g1_i1.p1 TRINITY_DN10977_c0_g1~~TRINITY_DN10977_c0_g1_i1.p1  ORF type:complete len:252 (-),score=58.04 TRINITY_DN10977_c0_g1_i1:166-921(-)